MKWDPRITGHAGGGGWQSVLDPSAHCWQPNFRRLSVRCLRPADLFQFLQTIQAWLVQARSLSIHPSRNKWRCLWYYFFRADIAGGSKSSPRLPCRGEEDSEPPNVYLYASPPRSFNSERREAATGPVIVTAGAGGHPLLLSARQQSSPSKEARPAPASQPTGPSDHWAASWAFKPI